MENGKHEAPATALLETSVLQKYAPLLLSAATAIFAGFQTLTSEPVTTTTFVTFLSLLLTTFATYFLPLTGGRYAGWLKTGAEVAGVLFAVALPFFAQNGTLTKANWLLLAVAAGKALLTHFGVAIRTDTDLLAAKQTTDGAYNVTTLPADPGILPDPAGDDPSIVSAVLPDPAPTVVQTPAE